MTISKLYSYLKNKILYYVDHFGLFHKCEEGTMKKVGENAELRSIGVVDYGVVNKQEGA